MRKRFSLLLTLPLLLAACDVQPPLAPAADAVFNKGQEIKAENSQGLFRVTPSMFPFYTRTELDPGGNFGYRTGEWAAIVFYRDPSCVPADFNLFEFYEFEPVEVEPGVWVPRVFLCEPTVDGFSLHVEPDGVTPPKQSNLHGSAVPIWFVPWSEFAPAVAAGSLTLGQLEAMPGLLKGVATHFRETLHTIEFHPVPKINITARGYILPQYGGGAFRYDINWPGLTVDDVRNVQIVIRQ